MNISTNTQIEWENCVENFYVKGSYKSHDEAIKAIIKLINDNQRIKKEIQIGLDELDAGKGILGTPELFDDIRKRGRERALNMSK